MLKKKKNQVTQTQSEGAVRQDLTSKVSWLQRRAAAQAE